MAGKYFLNSLFLIIFFSHRIFKTFEFLSKQTRTQIHTIQNHFLKRCITNKYKKLVHKLTACYYIYLFIYTKLLSSSLLLTELNVSAVSKMRTIMNNEWFKLKNKITCFLLLFFCNYWKNRTRQFLNICKEEVMVVKPNLLLAQGHKYWAPSD